MFKSIVIILAIPTIASAATIPEIIDAALERWHVPGAVVVIVRDDEMHYLQGHGRLQYDQPEPPSADTLFPLASCSKAFTTALMAQLVDAKRLQWDDPVRRHLRGFKLDDPLASTQVTLRDLVSHRTGVDSHDLLWHHAHWSCREMVDRVGRLPLSAPFRSRFQYQSVMFTAAGLACAEAGGATWAEQMQSRLFDPLGMKQATCRPQLALQREHATGHRLTNGKLQVVPWYAPEEPNPAGSVVVTGRDLVPWLRFQIAQGQLGDQRIVSAEALGETQTAQTLIRMEPLAREMNPETVQLTYGMGRVVQDYRARKLVCHGGAIDGFRAHIAFLPKERIGVAILANLQSTRMVQALSFTLIDHLLECPSRDWHAVFEAVSQREERTLLTRRAERAKQRTAAGPSLPQSQYVGVYRHRAYGDCRITLEEGKLIWAWSGYRAELQSHHGDVFAFVEDERLADDWLTAYPDGQGRVASLQVLGVTFERVP